MGPGQLLSRPRRGCRLLPAIVLVVSCVAVETEETPPSSAASGPTVVVKADPDLRALGDRVAGDSLAWRAMPGIGSALAIPASDTVTVWVVRDLRGLDSIGLGRPEPWVAGVASPARRLIALRVEGPQRNLSALRAVYRHEAAHVALHAATGGNVPRWLHEGYAQVASGNWNWNESWRLRFLLVRRGQSVLSGLETSFRSSYDPRSAYLLSYTATAYLHELAGDEGLAALFAELRNGQSFEGALRAVFGLTGRQFEDQWRRRVLSRYGWLYVFTRTGLLWLAVAGLVLGLGIARVRRDRERLRVLRDEERKMEADGQGYIDDAGPGA